MEPHRLPRRSASHGNLHSGQSHHVRPLHKPLRSVNENSALFPSPGPLESMLKTTTETGDIGIFSIKPMSSSGKLSLTLETTRLLETGGKKQPLAGRIEDRYRQDHRRGMPGYRDTTSEILSMYGSTSQSSLASTLAPSTDEYGRRSYSMTTCGSRQLSHNKSCGTMTSHGSGAPLQRPRSPFPYPTRLRRPGARPASPAVTENGLVDYSRMVEIDRISLRTVHGSYKSCYPHPVSRPPPLGLRSDANLSTPSFPASGPPLMPHLRPGTASSRTVSVASTVSRNPRPRERFNSMASRTSSLSSVVNMYQRMPPALKISQAGLLAPPPRYYDYTEGFETKETRSITPIEPIAPVPTRVSSVHKPLVLRDGSEERLAAALGLEAESTLFDEESQQDDSLHGAASGRGDRSERIDTTSDTREQALRCKEDLEIGIAISSDDSRRDQVCHSDIDLLPSQIGRASVDTFNPSLDLETRDGALMYPAYPTRGASSTEVASPSPARQVQVHGCRTPTIRSQKGSIRETRADESGEDQEESGSTRSDADNTETILQRPSIEHLYPAHSNDQLGAPAKSDQKTPYQAGRRESTISSNWTDTKVEVGLGTSAPTRTSVNANMLRCEEVAEVRRSSATTAPVDIVQGQPAGPGDQKAPEKVDEPSTGAIPKASIEGQPSFRRHKRNQAVLRIDTKRLTAPASCLEGSIDLKPSASTVPLYAPKPISPARDLKVKNSIPQLMKALPPVPSDADGSILALIADGEDELTEILQPFRVSGSSTPKDVSAIKKSSNLQRKLPKVKLKRESRPWNSDSNYPWTDRTSEISLAITCNEGVPRTVPKAKLKLRFTRPTEADVHVSETVRRRPSARESELSAELAGLRAKDFFSSFGLSGLVSETVTPKAPTVGSIQKPIVAGSLSNDKSNVGNSSSAPLLRRKRPRHARKSLSNLRWLLVKSSRSEQSEVTPTEKIEQSKDGRTRFGSFSSRSTHHDVKEVGPEKNPQKDQPQRYYFRQRIRQRFSSWVKRTRAAMKKDRRKSFDPMQCSVTRNA